MPGIDYSINSTQYHSSYMLLVHCTQYIQHCSLRIIFCKCYLN